MMPRKINTLLSLALIIIFLLHGMMGSFMLLGVGSGAGQSLAWFGLALIAAHTVIGLMLTIKTIRAGEKGGHWYLKQNSLFWTRRISGIAIIALAWRHIGLFGKMKGGKYIVYEFTKGRLITQLLLVAALFIHIFVNVRPLLVSLGLIKFKERRADVFLILSVFLLFFTLAVAAYYLGLKLL